MKNFVAPFIVSAGLLIAQPAPDQAGRSQAKPAENSQPASAPPDANRLPPDTNRQAPPPSGEKDGKVLVRRLEAVQWNPVRAELSWVVTVWDVAASIDQPMTRERYVIHLDDAVMEYGGEARRFDTTEARQVRGLMDLIATYAVESTVWWEAKDAPVQTAPPAKNADPPKSKEKTDGPEQKPKTLPKAGVAVGRLLRP